MEMLTSALPTRPDDPALVTVCDSCGLARSAGTTWVRPYRFADDTPVKLCDDCHDDAPDLTVRITWGRYDDLVTIAAAVARIDLARRGVPPDGPVIPYRQIMADR